MSPSEQPESEHKARQIRRAYGWVSLSLGAEGLVVASITSFMMLHALNVRNESCVDKVCNKDGIDANQTLGNLVGWNAGAWIIAGVGTVAGVYFLVTNPSDKALHLEVGAAPTGSGSGMLLRGTF
jgi:hypothetical protein